MSAPSEFIADDSSRSVVAGYGFAGLSRIKSLKFLAGLGGWTDWASPAADPALCGRTSSRRPARPRCEWNPTQPGCFDRIVRLRTVLEAVSVCHPSWPSRKTGPEASRWKSPRRSSQCSCDHSFHRVASEHEPKLSRGYADDSDGGSFNSGIGIFFRMKCPLVYLYGLKRTAVRNSREVAAHQHIAGQVLEIPSSAHR